MKSIFLSSQTIQQQMQNKTKFRIKNVLKANGGIEAQENVENMKYKLSEDLMAKEKKKYNDEE